MKIIHYNKYNIILTECCLESDNIKISKNLKDVNCINCLNSLIKYNKNMIFQLNDLIEEFNIEITIAHNNRQKRLISEVK